MSGTTRPNNKHLMICSGRAYPELAEPVSYTHLDAADE